MSLYEIGGIQPAALARDRALSSSDPFKQRYAGKTWTAVLNEDELLAAGPFGNLSKNRGRSPCSQFG